MNLENKLKEKNRVLSGWINDKQFLFNAVPLEDAIAILAEAQKLVNIDQRVMLNFAEFTPKQLNIIGMALENWLVEDTCISLNGKGGKPFIDKVLNSKTFFERLEEASKISA